MGPVFRPTWDCSGSSVLTAGFIRGLVQGLCVLSFETLSFETLSFETLSFETMVLRECSND